MFGCLVWPAEPVEVAQRFFELPGAVERGSFAPQSVEDFELVVGQGVGIFQERPAGVFDGPRG